MNNNENSSANKDFKGKRNPKVQDPVHYYSRVKDKVEENVASHKVKTAIRETVKIEISVFRE